MEQTQKHTFQILTKRPERMATLTKDLPLLRNVWLGTSIETGDYLARLDNLRDARAHARFVSFEGWRFNSDKIADVGQDSFSARNLTIA